MPTLTEAIDGLKAAAASAAAGGSAAPDASVRAEADARRDAVVRAMETALITAEAKKIALDAANDAALATAAAYFAAVAPVRADLSDGLPAAVDAEKDAIKTAVGADPAAADTAWLEPLRTAINEVDAAIADPVAAAEADVATKLAARDGAALILARRQGEMDAARRQLGAHAAGAKEAARAVRAALAASERARTANDAAGAIVALDWALDGLSSLSLPVDLSATSPAYDAGNATEATVTGALTADWSTAWTAAETALAAFVAAETDLLSARLDLETARIAALGRKASRDADARAAVHAALSP